MAATQDRDETFLAPFTSQHIHIQPDGLDIRLEAQAMSVSQSHYSLRVYGISSEAREIGSHKRFDARVFLVRITSQAMLLNVQSGRCCVSCYYILC
jgi:hypothetical protein